MSVAASVAPPTPRPDACRVVIIDDSTVVRGLIARWLGEEGGIEVVGTAPDGASGLKLVERVQPDVVVMDIEMPGMDGLTALPKMLELSRDLKIVMASTLTSRNAEISLKALRLGATDYVAKPSSARDAAAAEAFRRELTEKVKTLGNVRRRNRPLPVGAAVGRPLAAAVKPAIVTRAFPRIQPKVLAVGSSTGGPQALFALFGQLGGRIRQPILITQHMPATFTTILADHLSRIAGAPCREAKDGDVVADRNIYVAPGDYHMTVVADGPRRVIRLTQDPPENFCRPAVDPLLRSLAQVYGSGVLTVILTGMGQDGLKGARVATEAGGALIAQDEASSVVWGMPGAVATAGICNAVLPLNDIATTVERVMAGGAA